jgi:hypothetical protein
LDDLKDYLESNSWKKNETKNGKWVEYSLIDDKAIQIILPQYVSTAKLNSYLNSAINTLSALNDVDNDSMIANVANFVTDILYSKILEIHKDSIPLNVATNYISQFQKLVAFSTCSESSPKPYFLQKTNKSYDMQNHFQFGHTFPGSFGFTIKSRISSEITNYFTQLSMLDDQDSIKQAPLERRVLERIVTGLKLTISSLDEKDPNILIENYQIGFNANMIDAIIGMNNNVHSPIEFSVDWANKFSPSDESLINLENTPIIIERYEKEILEYASIQLRKIEPVESVLEGHIIGLESRENPSIRDGERTVILQWENRPDSNRKVKVICDLSTKDYKLALRAHSNWDEVRISGILTKPGFNFKLTDISSFTII